MFTYRQARNLCGIEQLKITESGLEYCSAMVQADIEVRVKKEREFEKLRAEEEDSCIFI